MKRELLDHWRPRLALLDSKRVLLDHELESLYVDRPDSPADDIAYRLLSESPSNLSFVGAVDYSKVVLCGARGSGKTTELTRIARILREDFVPLQLDLAPVLPEGSGSLPIVVLFGLALARALEAWSSPHDGVEAEQARRSQSSFGQVLERLMTVSGAVAKVSEWVEAIGSALQLIPAPEAQVASGAVGAAGATGRAASVAATQILQDVQQLRAIGAGPLGALRDIESNDDVLALVAAVNELIAQLTEASGRKPVLLADGLDRKSKEAILEALADWGVLKGLAAPIVLTGPPSLMFAPEFNGLRHHLTTDVLYNLPVLRRGDEAPCPTGIDALLSILRRRQESAGFTDRFIGEGVAERAALLSSGLVREFLDLLHAAGLRAWKAGDRSIGDDHLEQATRDRRLELQLALTEEHVRTLLMILDTGDIPYGPVAQELLYQNYVAAYPNGDLWYRPHEVLVSWLRDVARRNAPPEA
ncbi:MAG: hypothetical protein H6739_27445 [Alphaproteobacteria bacterium]|nr:hypothetical protein [Alphaproteobacteria bacterium]